MRKTWLALVAVPILGVAGWAIEPAPTTQPTTAPSTAPAPHALAHTLFRPDEIRWQKGPDSLPPGVEVAMLEGDLAQPGPFTVQARMPDGYKIPRHWHPAIEHVTVLQGTLHLGMATQRDPNATQALPAGSFVYMPPHMQHFAYAQGETIIQIHGIGPWGINYVNPADDPRNALGKRASER